jgi:hypothetical protein
MAWAPFAAMGASSLLDKLWGNDKMKQVPTMTKEQQALLNQILGFLGSGSQLGGGFTKGLSLQQQMMDPSSEAVEQFAAPYQQQFEQQTIPGLAERFAGMGALGGGLSSSGFGQALGAAGGNLQTQLAALKAGLGQQAAQSLMSQYGSMLGLGLGAQPFAYQQPAPSAFGGMFEAWGKAGFPGFTKTGEE